MNEMLEIDSLLYEAEREGVHVKLKAGGVVNMEGKRMAVKGWAKRLQPIKHDVAAYLTLAALVAHYCAAIKSQLGKPYAPDDAQELMSGACLQPAEALDKIVTHLLRESARIGRPFVPPSSDAASG